MIDRDTPSQKRRYYTSPHGPMTIPQDSLEIQKIMKYFDYPGYRINLPLDPETAIYSTDFDINGRSTLVFETKGRGAKDVSLRTDSICIYYEDVDLNAIAVTRTIIFPSGNKKSLYAYNITYPFHSAENNNGQSKNDIGMYVNLEQTAPDYGNFEFGIHYDAQGIPFLLKVLIAHGENRYELSYPFSDDTEDFIKSDIYKILNVFFWRGFFKKLSWRNFLLEYLQSIHNPYNPKGIDKLLGR